MKAKIRKVPSWTARIGIPRGFSFGISPYLFLCEEYYEEYKKNELSYKAKITIAHELTHIKREQKMGRWKFFFWYIFSDGFCFVEEMKAIEEEMKVCKECGKEFDTETRAKEIATVWIYHHCASYTATKRILDLMWSKT